MNDPMKAIAEMFYQQCVGTTNGHMAAIPNSPVISSIFSAIKGDSLVNRSDFSSILKQLADNLGED